MRLSNITKITIRKRQRGILSFEKSFDLTRQMIEKMMKGLVTGSESGGAKRLRVDVIKSMFARSLE